MKKFLSSVGVLVLVVLIPMLVLASPYLVCSSQTGVTSYQFTGDTFFVSPKTAETDGSIRYDLVGISNGAHTIGLIACNVWGCSTATPFTFTKAVPTAPAAVHVSP